VLKHGVVKNVAFPADGDSPFSTPTNTVVDQKILYFVVTRKHKLAKCSAETKASGCARELPGGELSATIIRLILSRTQIFGTGSVVLLLGYATYLGLPLLQADASTENLQQPVAEAVCGNGVTDAGESCDDGNMLIGDGCTACRVEEGYQCQGQPSQCMAAPVSPCGNGQIDADEMCDDGNGLDGDGCSALCEVEDGAVCRGNPSVCVADDSSSSVSVSSAESSALSSEAASSSSAIASSAISSEEASSSMSVSSIASSAAESSAAASASASSFWRVYQHRRGSDVSSSAAQPAAAAVSSSALQKAHCGDGLVLDAEQCDDQNNTDGDGCSAACAVERGYMCHGMPSTCQIACGDGVITAPETCDDRNNTDGDGCSASCHMEAGFGCTSEPTKCTLLTPEQ
jgi:cysteine-rich repeat protein